MSAAAASLGQPRGLAIDSQSPEGKAAQQRAHEPSMEEILASIRRIISDDTALPKAPKPVLANLPAPPVATLMPPPMAELAEVLPPVDDMPPDIEPPATIEAQSMVAEVMHEAPPLAEVAISAPGVELEEPEEILDLAHHVEAADAFAFLAPPPVVTRIAEVAAADAPEQAREPEIAPEMLTSPGTDAAVAASFHSLAQTVMLNNSVMIEQMTREMLRPMLKNWLDDNLPVMVERLVRSEIERVARGGR